MIQYKNLVSLQEFDLKVDAAKESIEEKKQKILKMQTEIDSDAQLLEKKQALHKKIQLRKRTLESDLNELHLSLRAAEMKIQNSGVTPNVYAALEKEIVVLKGRISEAETRVLEDMEKIETLEKDNEKGVKVVAGRREHLAQVKSRISDEIAGIRKEIDLFQTQRSQASLSIESDLLEIYETLRQKKRGRVLAGIDSLACPACGMALPAGFATSLTSSDEADACPNCSVLLYWTGPKEV